MPAMGRGQRFLAKSEQMRRFGDVINRLTREKNILTSERDRCHEDLVKARQEIDILVAEVGRLREIVRRVR